MPREIVQFVETSAYRGSGVLIDCTVGEGGHSELLLERFRDIRIIAFDRDGDILTIARERLKQHAGRIDFINDNFSHISQHLDSMRNGINYFLFDFGISSYHLNTSGRGFSFAKDERLDMRLDDGAESAYHIVNTAGEKTLAEIIFRYGEERWSRKIASALVHARRSRRVDNTG